MEYRFSASMGSFRSSAVRDILKLTQGNSIISFAGGLPAEEHFPLEAVKEAFGRVFTEGKRALQYGITEGFIPLREDLCKRMARKGMKVDTDRVLLTSGSQQALDLLARVYLDPGDTVIVQEPTYLAALQVFQSHGAAIVSAAGDEHGMYMDDLAAKIAKHHPKLVYVNPTFSNPTGYVWSLERRRALIELCSKYGVLILEDDPYGELRYTNDEPLPTLFSLDDQPHPCVVYTSTFSKIVAPALRTGWVLGDPEILRMMAKAKQAADLHSGTVDQQALHQLLLDFDLDAHIGQIRSAYGARLKHMLELLPGLNVPGLNWSRPTGGMFLWLNLPEGWNAADLLKIAVTKGVAFVPGESFFAERPKPNTCRLNFSYSNEEIQKTGLERLAKAIETYNPQVLSS